MTLPFWLLCLSTLCFLLAAGGTLWDARDGVIGHSRLQLFANLLGFGLQMVFLGMRGRALEQCPITSVFEILVFVAWTVMIFYFFTGSTFRLSLLGAFAAPLAALLQIIALTLHHAPRKLPDLQGKVEIHATLSLLAYGALGLACVAGIMYLLQDRALKKHSFGGLHHQMPSLQLLGKAMKRVLLIGTVLLLIGLVFAFGLREPAYRSKFLLTVGIVAVYSGFTVLGLSHRLTLRKLSWAMIVSYVMVILSFWFLTRRS